MTERSVRLGFQHSDKTFILLTGAVAGTALGIVAPYVAGWLTGIPGVPFHGPLDTIASFDSSWMTWLRPLIGLLVGLGLAAYVIYQSPVLTVTSTRIEVTQHGDVRRIARSDVAGIYRRRGKIVVENEHGRRLFEGEVEGGRERVRDTFVSFGYPWESA